MVFLRTHLYEGMEDLEDLLLDEDGEDGAVDQQLADELLDSRQEDLHGCQQRLPLLCLPVSTTPQTCMSVHAHTHTQRNPEFIR